MKKVLLNLLILGNVTLIDAQTLVKPGLCIKKIYSDHNMRQIQKLRQPIFCNHSDAMIFESKLLNYVILSSHKAVVKHNSG